MEPVLSAATLALFIPAVLVLILTPGPVVLYVVTRSIDQGRKAGVASVLGSEIGNFCHVLAAVFGLSAILLSSTLVFDILKYLGAVYLIYLGIRKLRSKDTIETQVIKPESLWRIFLQGIVVAVLNPKTALFFFAFLPQFVDSTRDNVALQILLLGIIMVTMATISDMLYALMAGTIGGWLKGNLRFLRLQRYLTGSVYIGLGITAAMVSANKK